MSPQSTPRGWVLGRVGGADVVVQPASALLGLLIAGSWYPLAADALTGLSAPAVVGAVAATVAGAAVSILAHELAHGAVGAALGRSPVLYELHLWGGRTTFGPAAAWRPWKDALTSLAGPAANLALWAAGRAALEWARPPLAAAFALWALTWVNLALAVFNALPALPLDGGHALAAAVEQVTGRARLGRTIAAWGGLAVIAAIAWQWIARPLLASGRRPDSFSLILAVMVAWPIAATSWRVLGLGRGERAAARLDLRDLARPVAVVPSRTDLERVRRILDEGAALVLVADGPALLGAIDDAGLTELGAIDERRATAGQVCLALPARAVTTTATGPEAARALKAARTVSRWLVLVEDGRMSGAVPTGAR